MAVLVLLAFILVPLVEVAVFIEVGVWIGLWPTLGIIVLTAILGTWLLRIQGLATLGRAQQSIAQQRFPVEEVFDGLCLLFAGALLLTPGFVTDAFGFSLFIPAFRSILRRAVWRYLKSRGKITIDPGMGPDGGTVIDGDYREMNSGPSSREKGTPPRIPRKWGKGSP